MFVSTLAALPPWAMYVIIGVVFVVMIVLTVVPQKKRQKEQQNMLNNLTVGTKLMTVGGIVGKITQVNADNTLIVNVGTENNPTLIVIDKKAVGYVLEKSMHLKLPKHPQRKKRKKKTLSATIIVTLAITIVTHATQKQIATKQIATATKRINNCNTA